jgi:hypothetical protein
MKRECLRYAEFSRGEGVSRDGEFAYIALMVDDLSYSS